MRPSLDWADDEVAILKRGIAAGLCARQIAAQLPRRNRIMVNAKAWRLGMAVAAPRMSNDGDQRRDTRPISDNELFTPVALRKPLEELERGDCHWPNGMPGEPGFHYCSKPSVPGKPYCEAHCRRAFMPAVVKRRRVAEPAAEDAPAPRELALSK